MNLVRIFLALDLNHFVTIVFALVVEDLASIELLDVVEILW